MSDCSVSELFHVYHAWFGNKLPLWGLVQCFFFMGHFYGCSHDAVPSVDRMILLHPSWQWIWSGGGWGAVISRFVGYESGWESGANKPNKACARPHARFGGIERWWGGKRPLTKQDVTRLTYQITHQASLNCKLDYIYCCPFASGCGYISWKIEILLKYGDSPCFPLETARIWETLGHSWTIWNDLHKQMRVHQ